MVKKKAGHEAVTTQYAVELIGWTRAYAGRCGLTLSGVLSAALAEYVARREQTSAGPEPQLHHQKGRPPRDVVARQRALIARDGRGRKLRP